MTQLRSFFCILTAALCFFVPAVSAAATLDVAPAAISVQPGDAFTLVVSVASPSDVLNAISGTITFPTDLLSVSSVSIANSILTLWVQQPSFSNALGTVQWSGVVPNPGFTGPIGRVFSVRFVAQKAGTATVGFTAPEVLANDGNGTNILTTAGSATVSISSTPPAPDQNQTLLARITSSTHPDQTRWYNLAHVVLDWTNAPGVSAVRIGYDHEAAGSPTVVYSDPISHKELQLNDGTWYFHVQEKGPTGWGPVSTFRIQIDTVPPEPVLLQFPNGSATASSTIGVIFATTDALSGIDHYSLAVDGTSFTVNAQEGSGVYALPAGSAGVHTLSVTAFDKAGNTASAQGQFTSAGAIQTSSTPSLGSLPAWITMHALSLGLLILAAVALGVFLGWYLWYHPHGSRRRATTADTFDHMRVFVHRQFNGLKDAIVEEVHTLDTVKSERMFTHEEERLIARLQMLVDRHERAIEKELDSLDS